MRSQGRSSNRSGAGGLYAPGGSARQRMAADERQLRRQPAAASTMVRLVLPTSVMTARRTMPRQAPAARRRSAAPAPRGRSVRRHRGLRGPRCRGRSRRIAARSPAPTADRCQARSTAGQRRFTASAIDPPISPTPTIAIRAKGRLAQTPHPRLATGSRQMPRPIAGAMIRSSAISRSNCDGNIDCAPSLSA